MRRRSSAAIALLAGPGSEAQGGEGQDPTAAGRARDEAADGGRAGGGGGGGARGTLLTQSRGWGMSGGSNMASCRTQRLPRCIQ